MTHSSSSYFNLYGHLPIVMMIVMEMMMTMSMTRTMVVAIVMMITQHHTHVFTANSSNLIAIGYKFFLNKISSLVCVSFSSSWTICEV